MATLRRAEKDDLESVFELVRELEEGGDEAVTLDAFAPVYLCNINNADVVYLLAEEDGQPVGFGSIHVQWLLHHCGAVAEIQELVVTAACQGKGVGVELLKALEDEARRRGCLQVELCCNKKRVESNAFYGRRGFQNSHYKHTMKFAGKRAEQ